MTKKNEPPIFGLNGTILNADEMRPHSEWPKPEPQGMTRGQLKKFIASMCFVIAVTLATMIWIIP